MVDDMKHGVADRDGGRDGAGERTPVQRTEINILRIRGGASARLPEQEFGRGTIVLMVGREQRDE